MATDLFEFEIEEDSFWGKSEVKFSDYDEIVGGERKKVGKSIFNLFNIGVRNKTGKALTTVPHKGDVNFAIVLGWENIWKFEKTKYGGDVDRSLSHVYEYYKTCDVVPVLIGNSDLKEVTSTVKSVDKKGQKSRGHKMVINSKNLPLVIFGKIPKAKVGDKVYMIPSTPGTTDDKKDLEPYKIVLSHYIGSKVMLCNLYSPSDAVFEEAYAIEKTETKLELKKLSSDKDLRAFASKAGDYKNVTFEDVKTLVASNSAFKNLTKFKV
ncbi:DNA-binding virion core protein VP8/L4R [Carp edema virus]|nr:DNA-binding virion core protein VP8/L4R [Carp edema virus]